MLCSFSSYTRTLSLALSLSLSYLARLPPPPFWYEIISIECKNHHCLTLSNRHFAVSLKDLLTIFVVTYLLSLYHWATVKCRGAKILQEWLSLGMSVSFLCIEWKPFLWKKQLKLQEKNILKYKDKSLILKGLFSSNCFYFGFNFEFKEISLNTFY